MINNNNVYVDNKNNFYAVVDNENYGSFEIELLKEEGFHFVGDWFSDEEKNNLLDEIKKLSVNQQIELLKKLEDNWCVLPESKFDLESMKEEYLEWYEEFDQEDFEYWLLDEVLPELFNDIGWYDIETVCEHIMQYKKEFTFYELRGYCQGDIAYVWNADDKTFYDKDYLFSVCFDNWVSIYTSNEEGDLIDNEETVPGFYVGNSVDEYLEEYMKKEYKAKLASVVYK